METLERGKEDAELQLEREQLLQQIEEKKKIYNAIDLKPKDHISEAESNQWTEVAKEIEDLQYRLALVDEHLRKSQE
jgi:hypothetical protein